MTLNSVKITPKRIYVRYASVSRDQNSLQWQCSHAYRNRHVTLIVHCHWLGCWKHGPGVKIILSSTSIKFERLLNSKNNRSTPEFLRLLWDIVVYRLVAYLLNMICLILNNLTFIRFGIILTQIYINFLETRTSDRALICLNQLLIFSSFCLYPLSFSFTVLFIAS